MLIDTDAVQVHYERAENIVGSSTKMTVRRTEYLARVDIGNSLNRRGWGGQRIVHVREQHIFLYHQG